MNETQKRDLLDQVAKMKAAIGAFGFVPTEINGAHAEATKLADTIAAKDADLPDLRSKILAQINRAEKANQRIGERKDIPSPNGMLETLLANMVKVALSIDALSVDPEEPAPPAPPGPVTPGPGGSVGTVHKSGYAGPGTGPIRWKAFAATIYSVIAGDAGDLSFTAGSGGVRCTIGRAADLSDGITQAGSSPEIRVAAGETIYMMFPDGAVSQDLTVSIPR